MEKVKGNIQYLPYLEQLFGEMTFEQVEQVFSIAETMYYNAGEYLFYEGDIDDALYIVLSGRLRVLQGTEGQLKILGDIAAAEPVGELALFTKEPRSASVVAIRKSTVLRIDEQDYTDLIVQYPHFANTLTQFVISRLRRHKFQQRMASSPKNIALIKLQPEADLGPWTSAIRKDLEEMGLKVQVYHPEEQQKNNPQVIFDEIEESEGMNILVCDADHEGWAHQCLTYCDLVLVVSDFNAPSALYAIEKKLDLYSADILNKKVFLVLLHPEDAPMPTNTRRWFEGRNLHLHLHLRKNKGRDIRRFCRILTNRAIGLVLGGGGAKGFAHIGAARALMEAGIEFDFVGGTSAGALFGAGLTFTDFDRAHLERICALGVERKVTSNDYHLPFISLMSGRKMRHHLEDIFGERQLEDIWVTTFCISTNYSTASLKVHETGRISKQVEASTAIPGVFPPVIIDRQLHVDGGVMDNLPIEAMYQKPVRHVIAISLSSQNNHFVDIKHTPGAWEILLNKFTKKRRFGLPAMSSLLINSLTLNSKQKQEKTKEQVAFYLEMDLGGFGFLDWTKWKKLIDSGYAQTIDKLKTLSQNERFW